MDSVTYARLWGWPAAKLDLIHKSPVESFQWRWESPQCFIRKLSCLLKIPESKNSQKRTAGGSVLSKLPPHGQTVLPHERFKAGVPTLLVWMAHAFIGIFLFTPGARSLDFTEDLFSSFNWMGQDCASKGYSDSILQKSKEREREVGFPPTFPLPQPSAVVPLYSELGQKWPGSGHVTPLPHLSTVLSGELVKPCLDAEEIKKLHHD